MKNSVRVIVSLALAPCWALAQNGVVLINQSTVAAAGANRSTGGFPYTITQPGSYQLSGNLTVPAGVNGIVISASFVSLDLNGFDISCVGGCSGNGITDNGTPQSGITIRNGTVSGFGNGIFLQASNGSFIEKVTAQSNAHDGITTVGVGNNGSTIKDCFALNNGGNGIIAGVSGIVSGSVASGNYIGIAVNSGTLTGNTATYNNLYGFYAGSSVTLTGNTASFNGTGFDVGTGIGSTLTGNTANNNKEGFFVGTGSTLTGNTATGNSDTGFSVVCPSNLVGNTAVGGGISETEAGAGCNKANNLFF